MSEIALEDEVTLNFVVEGDNPCRVINELTTPLGANFNHVKMAIRHIYQENEGIQLYGLDLYKGNVCPEEVEHTRLLDEALLRLTDPVASAWPSASDVNKNLIHVIVRARARDIENMNQAATPESAESEFSQLIMDFNKAQLSFFQTAPKATSSSAAMPKNFRTQQRGEGYINIGRPAHRTGLPIVLYHPVFGHFLKRLRSTNPIDPEVYNHTRAYFQISQELYAHETTGARSRDQLSQSSFRDLLGDVFIKTSAKLVQADGAIPAQGASSVMIMEMKNEIGTAGSDPSIQAAQSYTKYWGDSGARRWVNWCCCPSILVAIAGPWMCILGAVFLDRPVVQPLTDFLWVGDNPVQPGELGHIARVFDSLNLARDELVDYYRTGNPPAVGVNASRAFPYFTSYIDPTGEPVNFAYKKRLCDPNGDKPIFLAKTSDIEKPRYIVVKFVQNYNPSAHKLLASKGLAPELLYDGTMYAQDQPGPDHKVIVMEYIRGVNLGELSGSPLPPSVFDDVETAVRLLHSHNIVFGDLREPNVMVVQDSNGGASGRAMLVDFDWCGQHMEGRYPLRMNMTLGWDEGVGPGEIMNMRHDIHMLEKLKPR